MILALCGLTLIAKSQTVSEEQSASVEQSTFGIQTGFLGVWVHNETRLSNKIALRSELGFDSRIFGGSLYEMTDFIMAPVITLEPRWYYNLAKRESKSKRIDGNSGNFISLKTSYRPDWFVISNTDSATISSDISFVPTWGIRRNLGHHFNYEVGLGFGYRYILDKQAGLSGGRGSADANLHLRIGYRF